MEGTPGIQAVTLDMDGTLYSLRRMAWRTWWITLPVADVFRDLRHVREQMRGAEPVADFRKEQARRLAALRGIPAQRAEQQVDRVIQRWSRLFARLRPRPGVRDTLTLLHRRGIRLGIVSDYPARDKLAGLGLDEVPFQVIAVAEEAGALKPHPAVFEQAAAALQAPADRVLHVGDREDCDVAGAQAAGMRTALFRRGRRVTRSRADLVFSHFGRLIPALESSGLLPPPRSPDATGGSGDRSESSLKSGAKSDTNG